MYLFSKMRTRLNFNFLVECGLSIQLASLAERSGRRPDQSFGLEYQGKVVKGSAE